MYSMCLCVFLFLYNPITHVKLVEPPCYIYLFPDPIHEKQDIIETLM